MAKRKTPVIDAPQAALARLDQDLGLGDEVSRRHRWLNDEGDAEVSLGQIQNWTRGWFENRELLTKLVQSSESMKAVLAHSLGTYAREFRGCRAWVKVGLATWDEFCLQHLQTSRRHVNRLVEFAGAARAEDAGFGLRKCLAGVQIADQLDLPGLSSLVLAEGAAEPPEWAEKLGEPVHFRASSAERLEELARGERRPKALPVEVPRRAKRLAADRRTVIEEVSEEHPALARLKPKSYVHKGVAKVKTAEPTNREEFLALEALYRALGRI